MTIPTNAFTTFASVGNREQLLEAINMISPTDTIFMNSVGKAKAEATFMEWQTDVLDTVDTANAQIEGDDKTAAAITATVRIGNRLQISDKNFAISRTQDIIVKAGRGKETARQLMKKTKSLKRDMESIMCGSQASVTGNTTTARKLGAIENMITTNKNINGETGGGYSASNWVAVVDGTQRPFTETLLKDVIKQVFESGGDPDLLMLGSFNKQVASSFTGNATRMDESEDSKLVTDIKIYQSDFGTFKVKPNRFQRSKTALLLQTDMWQVAYLDPIKPDDLAKTGDSTKKTLTVEYTLVGLNEAASGKIASLTTS